MRATLVNDLGAVNPSAWDALAGEDDPFAEHAFLHALEDSGSVGPGTGWLPRHVLVHAGGRLVAALAAYEKDDSWGEFVFDFGWARAAGQLGVRYFPKIVAMTPFTPATGARLLIAPDVDRDTAIAALVQGLRDAADQAGASSIHALYLREDEQHELVAQGGFRPRAALQFHWKNREFRTFDDFLATFRAPARKQVKRERRRVAEHGLAVRVKVGTELDATEWDALHTFYRANAHRHGSEGYLTPAFFAALRTRLAHRVVACLAYRDGAPIAGSLNFEKGRHLYGRYWGALEDTEFLHFECCYHRLIERAIERGLTRFEAGAQGLHKLKRGLAPSEIRSAHWIRHPRLAAAVYEFLEREAQAVRADLEGLAASGPFRRDGDPGEGDA